MPFLFANPSSSSSQPSGFCQQRRRGQGCPRRQAQRQAHPFNTFFDGIISALDTEMANQAQRQERQVKRVITPRFDVIETDKAYILEGELPGVSDKKSIDVEFSDAQTLVIKGEIKRASRGGEKASDEKHTQPAEQKQQEKEEREEQLPVYEEKEDLNNVAEEPTATTPRSRSPSVEDVNDDDSEGDEFEVIEVPVHKAAAPKPSSPSPVPSTPTINNESTSEKVAEQTPSAHIEEQQSAAPITEKVESNTATTTAEAKYKFWVAERRIGSFERAFKFETLVDQDAVTAQLNNGLLQIVVPKREPLVLQVKIQ